MNTHLYGIKFFLGTMLESLVKYMYSEVCAQTQFLLFSPFRIDVSSERAYDNPWLSEIFIT